MIKSTQYACGQLSLAALEIGHPKTADISVVFLHGWLDNAASFETIFVELYQYHPHLHLCAIDLPGHGLSEHKGDGYFYPFHDYIDDVYQLLATLSPNKLVLVGHSLGALIASCYSAAFPEQVAGLVQIEGDGPLAETSLNCVERLCDGVKSRQRIRRKPERVMATLEEAVARRSAINQLEPELIAPVVKRGLIRGEQGWQWRHDKKLQADSLYRMPFESAKQFRQQIVCPQLILLGEQGFAALKQAKPTPQSDVEVHIIAGGHHCHLQQPKAVAERIFGLLNKIETSV
ncbi:alpha/beta fold hydrolase [Vibrio sp. LaRot3]|uniref:alpha/beta fold hydrolase n=1 Tax=Vibrio sp. LaRot3 TaxID=2998829 RepID=UPI0022CE11C9|nr:alpha/beta hydrolase [Vibrio sp. LaRot3]MDA0147969.1 alpha/beta hydrolase [Vibrio sp. LaRot3]